MATAKDIMTAKPIVLESSTAIAAAVEVFSKNKFSSVPVMTTMGEIAGQLTELVLVRALVLSQLQPEKFKQLSHCQELLEPVHFVAPNASITEVIKALMKSPSRRVIVKSSGRQILGIISPKDLLRVLIANSEPSQGIREEIAKFAAEKD